MAIIPLSNFSKPTEPAPEAVCAAIVLSAPVVAPVVPPIKVAARKRAKKLPQEPQPRQEPLPKITKAKPLALEDGCLVCGCESDIGVIQCKNNGVLHFHYCSACYNSHIRHGDGQGNSVPRKKLPPKQWTKPALELKKKGLRVQEKNGGCQLVVTLGRAVFDYWPSTEKYVCRQTRTKGVGQLNMLIAIGLEVK